MSPPDNAPGTKRRSSLLDSLRETHARARPQQETRRSPTGKALGSFDFSRHSAYSEVKIARAAGETLSLASPFFRVAEEVKATELKIDGRWVKNFASYDYLSLNQSEAVRSSVKGRVDDWGISATASRLVGGERAAHAALEKQLATFAGTENALVMVSGHATNMAILRTLLAPGDLVLVDALAHNSIYEGIRASAAAHITFPHNNFDWVDEYLAANRGSYKNALIAIEGLYSMDGDTPNLPRFVDIKHRHRTWLMVDEAHSMGVLGATGRGVCEESGVDPRNVEIIMGTLSKSFCSCGGFVAGSEALTDLLRYKAPGFVYSVGLSTPNTAAAQAALGEISEHPEYVVELREKCAEFQSIAKSLNLNTGDSEGFAVCPVIIGDSLRSVWVSNQLLKAGYNVLPIIAPAVPDRSARLRFFLNRDHDLITMRSVLEDTARLIDQSKTMTVADLAAS